MPTKAKAGEFEITQAVRCPLPGFETVEITFNLMATPEQSNGFIRHMGSQGSHAGVVVSVEGWPKDEFGPDPWDVKRVPMIWTTWAAKKGLVKAIEEYLADPNS